MEQPIRVLYFRYSEICFWFAALRSVWPDWAIFCTLGYFLKPLASINLPKSPTFLGIFCKGVYYLSFSGEIILGNFYRHLAIFIWSDWWHWTRIDRICVMAFLYLQNAFYKTIYALDLRQIDRKTHLFMSTKCLFRLG